MKRVRAAFWLLAFLAVLIVASSILVRTTNNALLADLDRISRLSASGDYAAALEAIDTGWHCSTNGNTSAASPCAWAA